MKKIDDPLKDWPYGVMQDLVAHLRKDNLAHTAEMIEDAAVLFLEERRRSVLAQAGVRAGRPPGLRLVGKG